MKSRTTRQLWPNVLFVSIAILVLVLLALMIGNVLIEGAGVYVGMSIILGVGVLLIMLTIMTIVFARLDLADSKQALGLPEGSIRALIALILLLVFIVLSVYMFREVGFSNPAINPDGAKLAQQLVTTLATLAVAVSGFYFGTSTVAAARGISAPSSPIIRSLETKEGKPGDEIPLKVIGKNFRLLKTVRLERGSKEINATSILSSDTEIQCRIQIPVDIQAGTTWDLIVVNEDGGEDMLTDAFSVS